MREEEGRRKGDGKRKRGKWHRGKDEEITVAREKTQRRERAWKKDRGKGDGRRGEWRWEGWRGGGSVVAHPESYCNSS